MFAAIIGNLAYFILILFGPEALPTCPTEDSAPVDQPACFWTGSNDTHGLLIVKRGTSDNDDDLFVVVPK